jgi:hypothetical protein
VLQATKDLRKVALWLGHAHMQTTEMYTRADPSVKLEALESMIAPKLRSGRFKATDKLIASLTSRSVMRRPTPSDCQGFTSSDSSVGGMDWAGYPVDAACTEKHPILCCD